METLTNSTMTEQKKKAKELIEKFSPHSHSDWHDDGGWNNVQLLENAKQCAIICVDYEIKILQKLKDKLQSMSLLDSTFEVMNLIDELQQVKQEIINYIN